MELVAIKRRTYDRIPAVGGRDRHPDLGQHIGGIPFEIVVEVECVFDQVGIGLPRSGVVGLRHAPRQREAGVSPPSVGSSAPYRPIWPDVMARSGTWSVESHLLE